MAVISTLRAELAEQLATVTNIAAEAYVPRQISGPVVTVVFDGIPEVHMTMGAGRTEYRFKAQILCPDAAGHHTAEELFDGWLNLSGATSLIVALEADPSLDGNACSVQVDEVSALRTVDVGGVPCLTADLNISVVA